VLEGSLYLIQVAEIAAAKALVKGRHELLRQRRAEISGDQGFFEHFQVSGAWGIRTE
jgi:hypothetical protein